MKSTTQTRSAKKQAERDEKVQVFKKQLRPGEKVKMEVEFSVMPNFALYLIAAVIMIVLQRQNIHLILNAVCGIGCMWMGLLAAQTCLYVQNSVILITNYRIFGLSGDTKCSIDLGDVRSVRGRNTMYIDGGKYNGIRVKNIKNPDQVAQALREVIS